MKILLYIRDIVAFAQPFIVFVTGCITFYLLLRTRPRKIGKTVLAPDTVVINWSGHPLPDASWIKSYRVWEPLQTINFAVESWETLAKSVQKIIRDLPKDIQLRLLQGDPNIVIIIPQLGAGLAMLLAILHGTTGVFPNISCPLRKREGGFQLPEPVQLSEVRLRTREVRDLLL